MTETQSLTIDFRTSAWGRPPYNGATTFRPDFDSWLADQAVAAGAELVCSTTVTGLVRDGNRVVGVRTDRPDGELAAGVVIACDGVNSLLAKEAGLYPHADDPSHFTLGAKEVLALPRETIEARFNLTGDEGADFEIVGCTGGLAGGGFIYTNLDTVSVGVVLRLTDLAGADSRPEELISALKAHPMVEPLVRGGELVEYSAHLIPEGGYDMMPTLGCDGMLVSGDAAAFCLGAGLWLEGVNFAIGGGALAAESAVRALDAGRTGPSMADHYRRGLEGSFVLADHKKLRRAPGLLMSDRVQLRYPRLACDLVQGVFEVTNPDPKPGISKLFKRARRANGVKRRQLLRDAWTGHRSYG